MATASIHSGGCIEHRIRRARAHTGGALSARQPGGHPVDRRHAICFDRRFVALVDRWHTRLEASRPQAVEIFDAAMDAMQRL